MRDKIKDIKYFDEFILKIEELLKKTNEHFNNNRIKPERVLSARRNASKNYLKIQ